MRPQLPLLVFTDLDGTLLSHVDYSWDPASPALERLAAIGAGVVMASSKTAPEIHALRQDLCLQAWPAIVENGAGLLAPHAGDDMDRSGYAQLRAGLQQVAAPLREKFQGFGDMDAREVAEATGLSHAQAVLAQDRAFSEPGTWSGTADEKSAFLKALQPLGISAREGGRFLTLSFGATKADQMARIIQDYAPQHTIALGDAPNDVEMLQAADSGVIIANPHRDPLPILDGETGGRILRTTQAGPDGWNAAILAHLARLSL
ncbi:HAD-IIB family hydrolase [Sulfitobacter sp. HNIBRBA2951]|uniref:HAD-IIB family hydrolase n=1 Tax=Sulfitobacter aquimarinus TaxID=3158557 RepID=UPI0032DE4D0F